MTNEKDIRYYTRDAFLCNADIKLNTEVKLMYKYKIAFYILLIISGIFLYSIS